MHTRTGGLLCVSCAVVASILSRTKSACLCTTTQMGVWGMGAASLETELLWVGGPIAIQRTSTWSMSDVPCEDIPGEHIVCVFN